MNVITKLKEGDKFILCFWDQKIYPFQSYGFDLSKESYKELVEKIKSLLDYYKVDYHIIYLSDAFSRLLNNEQTSELLYSTLGRISLGYIKEHHEKNEIPYNNITINKITFVIADYLIALYINKLFPELRIEKITNYYSGKKFKSLFNKIEETISEKHLLVNYPEMLYVNNIPVLNYISGKWISVGMSKNEIEREIAYSDKVDSAEGKDILSALSLLINKNQFVLSKDHKLEKTNLPYVLEIFSELDKKDKIITLTENLFNFLETIKGQILDAKETSIKKVNYVKNQDDFRKIFVNLNPKKLEIIKLCDGTKTISEIVKLSPLKESSTRSYLSRLRAKDLITKDEMPKRRIDEILISFN